MTKIAVFASGQGSNLQALIDSIRRNKLEATIELVVCDREGALAVSRAKQAGISSLVFSPRDYHSKAEYEEVMGKKLAELKVQYLVLAGYMRLVGPTLLTLFPRRIINIHPSLLPRFPGKDAIGQALKAGARETGVTVHYVDEGMDTGPIIAQESISVEPGEKRASLEQRIHRVEHELYPRVLQQIFVAEEEEHETCFN